MAHWVSSIVTGNSHCRLVLWSRAVSRRALPLWSARPVQVSPPAVRAASRCLRCAVEGRVLWAVATHGHAPCPWPCRGCVGGVHPWWDKPKREKTCHFFLLTLSQPRAVPPHFCRLPRTWPIPWSASGLIAFLCCFASSQPFCVPRTPFFIRFVAIRYLYSICELCVVICWAWTLSFRSVRAQHRRPALLLLCEETSICISPAHGWS